MKTVMLIGRTGCGKTTLTQALNGEKIHYKKTQTVEITENVSAKRINVIDTPGEYIENRCYYKALIVTSADSDVIVLLQDCTDEDSIFPPGFGSIFSKPVIGVVTKCDLCKDESQITKAKEVLINAGAEEIITISSTEKTGLENFNKYIY